jgi:hypothetical protein
MSTRWTISEDVVWAGDQSVRLYDINTGDFQTLNGSASAIWGLVAEGRSTDEIISSLVEKYSSGDPREQQVIEQDVREFLADMSEKQVLLPAEVVNTATSDAGGVAR